MGKTKVVFLSRKVYTSAGGVERHINSVANLLKRRGFLVVDINNNNIGYPKIKLFGLLYIWSWLFRNRTLIELADVIHIHDVFIWYLPFKLFCKRKPLLFTQHGWETVWPIPLKNLLFRKMGTKLSTKTVVVGKYIEKYYRIRADKIIYGAAEPVKGKFKKDKNSIVFVGRLEKDTGVLAFLKWLDGHMDKWSKVDFCGDGSLRSECEKFGTVHGFTDPKPYYKKAKYCVPGGYLAALEGLSYRCKLKLFWDSTIKEDYWKMSPFYKLKGKKLKEWAKKQTWEALTDEYISLYNSIK